MSLKPKPNKKRNQPVTMFYDTPTDQELAEIISIRNPREAKESVAKVVALHDRTPSHDRMIHLERALLLAANRAKSFLNSPELSPKEQKEMKSVSKIYRKGYDHLAKTRKEYEQ